MLAWQAVGEASEALSVIHTEPSDGKKGACGWLRAVARLEIPSQFSPDKQWDSTGCFRWSYGLSHPAGGVAASIL